MARCWAQDEDDDDNDDDERARVRGGDEEPWRPFYVIIIGRRCPFICGTREDEKEEEGFVWGGEGRTIGAHRRRRRK